MSSFTLFATVSQFITSLNVKNLISNASLPGYGVPIKSLNSKSIIS